MGLITTTTDDRCATNRTSQNPTQGNPMTDFLNRHTLHLTPLSPIHLGTGEDYEPTNYVIYDNALYAFDPAQAELDDWQRQELLKLVRRINAKNDMEGLVQIKSHIQKNAKHFIRGAYSISSTTNKLAEEYQELKDNQFRIERTATNPHSHAPYIPGSALKGCLRTTLMEIRSEKQPPETYHLNNPLKEKREQQLYGDALLEQYPHNPRRPEFSSDQLRLTKPSDLTANYDIFTHICYAVNRKKERAREKETLYGRRETIPHGQYRAFSGSLAQYDLTEDNRRHAKKPLAEQYPRICRTHPRRQPLPPDPFRPRKRVAHRTRPCPARMAAQHRTTT